MIDVRPDGFVVLGRERARPLAPDERRAAIIDAVIPLIREHGRAISSRQMAEAAGIAEGTLFRAFGDKDSVVQAAFERFMDPEPFRNALRGIDPDEPTEDKVRQVLSLLQERFTGVVGMMTAMGMQGPPPGLRTPRPSDDDWLKVLDRVFRPDELAIPIPILGFYLRLLAFGSAVPHLNTAHTFSTDELADVILHGVLPGTARSFMHPAPTGKKD